MSEYEYCCPTCNRTADFLGCFNPDCEEKDEEVSVEDGGDGNFWVQCESCWSRGPTATGPLEAIEAWNKIQRAPKTSKRSKK